MRAEARRAARWNLIVPISTLSLFFLTLCAMSFVLTVARHPLSKDTYYALLRYIETAWPNPLTHYLYLLHGAHPIQPVELTVAYSLASLLACGLITAFFVALNPHRAVDMIHGDARFATRRDVELMTAAGQVGWHGEHMHFGYFKGRAIQLIETLSCFIQAPPGTGKTAGLLVPSVLVSDRSCLVIHDPKPELSEICSGYRAALGPCYILNWAAIDDEAKGVYHPSFNFLDPQILPPPGAARDTFVDNLTKTLLPEDKGKSDPYFLPRGRSALAGFLMFIISHLHDAPEEKKEQNYKDLPPEWHGKDVSFPMLIDWLTRTQLDAVVQAKASGDKTNQEDPLAPYLQRLIDITIQERYPERIVRELQPLIVTARDERSGILGQMTKGLGPFNNSAAVQRTSRSDFVPADLSGRIKRSTLRKFKYPDDAYPRTRKQWDELAPHLTEDDWEPVTVFVSISQDDAAAFEGLTTLFFETLSRELLSYGPGERKPDGTIMGPFATGFLIDEVPKMATCNAVIEGPNVGRSKQRYYMIICQTADQLKERYSESHMKTILGSCAVQAVLKQGMDPETIDRIARTVGDTTIKRRSITRNVGLSKSANPFAGSASENIQGTKLLQTSTLTAMPPNQHLLIVQGFISRPIWCVTAPYFKDRKLKHKAFNPRTGTGTLPAPPLPPDAARRRYDAYRRNRAAQRAADNIAARHRDLEDWRYNRAFNLSGRTPYDIP